MYKKLAFKQLLNDWFFSPKMTRLKCDVQIIKIMALVSKPLISLFVKLVSTWIMFYKLKVNELNMVKHKTITTNLIIIIWTDKHIF